MLLMVEPGTENPLNTQETGRDNSGLFVQVLSTVFQDVKSYDFSTLRPWPRDLNEAYDEDEDQSSGWTSGIRIKNVGRVSDRFTDADTGDLLDIDVIDVSSINSTTRGIQHDYLSLNRELVQDITDLLITQRRAHQRQTRLEWLEDNRFAFLVEPSNIL